MKHGREVRGVNIWRFGRKVPVRKYSDKRKGNRLFIIIIIIIIIQEDGAENGFEICFVIDCC